MTTGSDHHAAGTDPPRLWPLYLGGFLGPFAAIVPTPMLPEIADDLTISVSTAGLAVSSYLFPFAVVLIVSGSLAERFGRNRSLLIAYSVFIASSVALAFATTLGWLVALRATQGIANAFITPVLIALLADLVPAGRLGRTLGILGSVQASGQAFAPLIGGFAAAVSWRWAFVGSGLAAAVLLIATPRSRGRPTGSAAVDEPAPLRTGSLRAVMRPDILRAALVAGASYLTVLGILVIGALWVSDDLGVGPIGRGLIIAIYGVTGLIGGSVTGRGLDRFGIRRAGTLYALGLAVAAVTLSLPGLVAAVAALVLGGAAGTGLRTATNLIAVRAAPDNRGGAVSLVLAMQFLGGALGPVLWLPIYDVLGGPTLALCSIGALAAALLLALTKRS